MTHFRARFMSLSMKGLGALGALALAGCGGTTDDPATAPSAVTSAPVAIAETLGTFDGTVSDLAVWEHPSVPFLSTVLATNGAAGLFQVPVNQSAPLENAGVFNGAVAVSYSENGDIVAAVDGGAGLLRLYTLSDAGTLEDRGASPLPGGALDLCLRGETLYAVGSDGAVGVRTIVMDAGEWRAMTSTPVIQSALACATAGDALYLLTQEGTVLAVDDQGVITEMAARPGATDLTLWEKEDGSIQFATLDATGAVRIGDVQLTPTPFASDGPATALVAIEAGNGNFGGVFRDGMLVGLTASQELVLIPWLGIAQAAGLNGATVGQRPVQEVLADITPMDLAPVETNMAPN